MSGPSYIERWINPGAPATVTGPAAAFAPAAPGAVQTWNLAGGYAAWPVLPAGGAQIIRLYDPHMPLEIVRVTAGPAAAAITVIRGDQGSTPTAHRPGFEVACCLSAEGMTARAQGVASGLGLITPGASAFLQWSNTVETELCGVDVPGGEARPGAEYEAFAFGYLNAGNIDRAIDVGQDWGSNTIGYNTNWSSPAGQDCRFRMHGWVSVHAGLISSNYEMLLAKNNNAAVTVWQRHVGPVNPAQAVDFSAPARYRLYARWTTAGPGTLFCVQGGRAWRAA
jgi:hypothetical protein